MSTILRLNEALISFFVVGFIVWKDELPEKSNMDNPLNQIRIHGRRGAYIKLSNTVEDGFQFLVVTSIKKNQYTNPKNIKDENKERNACLNLNLKLSNISIKKIFGEKKTTHLFL